MKHVCVFAASSDNIDQQYVTAARRLGELLAQRGYGLIYGGGKAGLMGPLAFAVRASGGRVVGVIPEKLRDHDLAWEEADEIVVTRDLRDRKELMAARADAFIALPGGFGTLDETLEALTFKQLWYHEKPLVLLNTAGVYDRLIEFFEELMVRGFITPEHRDLYYVCNTPEETIAYLDAYTPPEPHAKWF
jgi:hypothetical protein